LILQHLASQEVTASGAAARWPSYAIVKEKVSFPREALAEGYVALQQDLAAEVRDETDGLRLAWPEKRAWLHVRPSGTEPIVRLIAEASDEASAKALVKRAADVLAGVA
jgi:phosphomannomutase